MPEGIAKVMENPLLERGGVFHIRKVIVRYRLCIIENPPDNRR